MEQNILIDGNIEAFFTHPNDTTRKAIILIHEIWGLNDHIKDVARRLQKEGYSVLAPNILAGMGILELISPTIFKDMQDPIKRSEAQKKLRDVLAPTRAPDFSQHMINKVDQCYNYLKKKGFTHIAIMGFCFGGTYSYALSNHELKACIPFYGQPPMDIAGITCPILAFYGENDTTLTMGLESLSAEMKKHHKNFTYKVYKNTGHAFFNDTNTVAYNKEAAQDSWKLLLAFLQKNMN